MSDFAEKCRYRNHHDLKIDYEYWRAVYNEYKKAEVRKDDRDFQVGDLISFKVYSDGRLLNDGDNFCFIITHILRGGQYGIKDGYVMLSIEHCNENELSGI